MGKGKGSKTRHPPRGPEGPGHYAQVRTRRTTLPHGPQEKPQTKKSDSPKPDYFYNIPGRTLAPPPLVPAQDLAAAVLAITNPEKEPEPIKDLIAAPAPTKKAEVRQEIKDIVYPTPSPAESTQPSAANLDGNDPGESTKDQEFVNLFTDEVTAPSSTTSFGVPEEETISPMETGIRTAAENRPLTEPPVNTDETIDDTPTQVNIRPATTIPPTPTAPESFSPSHHPWFNSELPTDPQGFLRVQRAYFRCLNRAVSVANEQEKIVLESLATAIEIAQDHTDLGAAIQKLFTTDLPDKIKKIIRDTAEFIAGKASIDADRRSFQRLDELLPPSISTSNAFQKLHPHHLATQLIVEGKAFDFIFDPNSFDIGSISLPGHENNIPTLQKFAGRSLMDPGTLQKLAKVLQEIAAAPGKFIGLEILPPGIHTVKDKVFQICSRVTDTFNKRRKRPQLVVSYDTNEVEMKINIALAPVTESIIIVASENGPMIHKHETLQGYFTEKMFEGIVTILDNERKAQSGIRSKIPFLSSTRTAEEQRATRQAAFVALSLTVAGSIGAYYAVEHPISLRHTETPTTHTAIPHSSLPLPLPSSPSSPSSPLPIPPVLPALPLSVFPHTNSPDSSTLVNTSAAPTSSVERIGTASVGNDRDANTERALIHILSAIPDIHVGHSAHIINRKVLIARLRHALEDTNAAAIARAEQTFIQLHYDTGALINQLRSEGEAHVAARIIPLRTRPGHDNVVIERRELGGRRQIRISVERDGRELYNTSWLAENQLMSRIDA